MSIPRRYLFIAAGAAAAAGFMYVRNKMDERTRKEREQSRERERERRPSPAPTAAKEADAPRDEERASERADMAGGVRELSEFLAGDSWFDEPGWKSIWTKEGIEDPAGWLKDDGLQVLKSEREKLSDHPALLAGCRRRWIVVARYAGIDVGDAATLWNEVDA